jgi:hypothetical protein
MTRLLVGSLVAASLAGCGNGSANRSTDLTLLAVNPSVGRAAFHLTCAPPGGDLGNPAGACAALAAHPQFVTKPKPFVCMGGTFSWWDVMITGRLHGRRIYTHTSTCWTPQMAMLRRLGMGWPSLRAHMLPRRHEAVLPSSREVFPSGALRPGDLVTSTILGHHLEEGVPLDYDVTASNGYGGKNVTSVTLAVTRNRDGSVTASCHVGDA